MKTKTELKAEIFISHEHSSNFPIPMAPLKHFITKQ